jgi:hypothetical protein
MQEKAALVLQNKAEAPHKKRGRLIIGQMNLTEIK